MTNLLWWHIECLGSHVDLLIYVDARNNKKHLDPVANADKVASRATAEMPSRKTSKQPNSSPTQLNDDPEANRDIVANQEKDDTPAGITSNNVLPREDMLEETTFLPAIPLKMFYRGKKCQGGKEAGSPGSECGKTVAIANLDALRKL